MSTVTCQNCRAQVELSPWRQPIRYFARAADALGPALFLIVGADDTLLHSCPIVAEPVRHRHSPAA